MENKYYTYTILDPRKPGNYKYGKFVFKYEPFYIGKGQSNRYKAHINEALSGRRKDYKNNKIKKIIRETGKEPIIIKIHTELNKYEAVKKEKYLIKTIGRKNRNKGPLVNNTDGGDGMLGWRHTKRTKALIALSNHNRTVSEETKRKIAQSLMGFKHTAKFGKRQSKRVSGKNNYFYGKRFTGIQNWMYRRKLPEKTKKIISKLAKKRTGIKNPNMKYAYCLYNSKKGAFHKVFDLVETTKNKHFKLNRAPKKGPFIGRRHGWIIVRVLKNDPDLKRRCPCKIMIKAGSKIQDISLSRYLKVAQYSISK